MRDTFGTIPEDDQGVAQPDAPPALAIPLMIAAADESRDELQDIWAAL